MQRRLLILAFLSLVVGCHTMSRSKAISTSLPSSATPSSDLTAATTTGATKLAATQQLLERRRNESPGNALEAEDVEAVVDSSRRGAISHPTTVRTSPVQLAAHSQPHLAPPRLQSAGDLPSLAPPIRVSSTLPVATVTVSPEFQVSNEQTWTQDDVSGEVMSLDQFEHMALANNPSLTEAMAFVEAAQGRCLQAGLPPNFALGYSGQQIFSGGAAEQEGLYFQQEIVRGRKLELSRAVAMQEVDKARQNFAAQRQRVLTDVRLAYYNVLVAQRRNEVTHRLQEIAQASFDTAESLFRASEISRFNVMQTEVELQATKLEFENALTQHESAWEQLIAVTGVGDLPMRPLAGELDGPIIEIDVDQVMSDLIARSPELAAALEEVERARWAVDRAVAEPVGNVDFQAVIQNDNAERGTNANFQVSIPLPFRNRNQGGIRAAQAEVMAAERAVDRMQLSLAQRLAMVYQRYSAARQQVEQYSREDGILDVSQRMLDVVRTGYEAGELEYRDLMLAQRNHAQKNLAYIEALGAYWIAVTEIDGLLLKDSLNGVASGKM